MNSNRPLSPHLQVYKLPLTGLISITHRITGVALSAGLLLVVYMLVMIASGAEAYAALQQVMQWWLVKLVYWGMLYALFFHLCHGVRHLIWDTGKSFDKAILQQYALYELLASLLLTATTLLLI
ncbi:MAG: succinate dehydrogenase, cytochrome b556 subunit [Methylococcaceae bacterium]|nr:succinate dehydrogenase, cytochrome b556 subunit [Methylococcaceae bacterium]